MRAELVGEEGHTLHVRALPLAGAVVAVGGLALAIFAFGAEGIGIANGRIG